MTSMPIRTLVDLVRLRAETLADRCAYRFLADGEREEASLTYAELDRAARACAARIRQRVDPGTAVVLTYPAGLDFISAFLGCLYAGAIAVPVSTAHPRRGNDRLAAIVADCAAPLMLSTSAGARAVAAAAMQCDRLASIEVLATDGLTGERAAANPEHSINGETCAFLQYTSGSTRCPRGVRISHANVLANLIAIHAAEGAGAHSRSLSWLPAFHDMGLIEGILQPLYGGYPAWLMPHATFLQRPARWLQAISRLGVTVSGGPNFAFDLCVRRVRDDEIGALDLSSWDVAYCGAEPVRAQTLEAFAQRFGICGFRRSALRPVYGLAEATLLVAASGRGAKEPRILYARADQLEQGQFVHAADDCSSRVALVSCGEPVAGTELAIVDPATEGSVGAGAIGEIWVSGPSVAIGYRSEDASSGSQFTTREVNGVRRRWLRTGDLGFIAAGELIVSGRIKDLIIVRGRKLHPQDLEQAVQGCDERILPNAVAAFSLLGAQVECVAICVEISPRVLCAEPGGSEYGLEALADAIRECVFRQHAVAVASVAFVRPGALARTTSGKLMRYRCRRDLMSGNIDLLRQFDTSGVQPYLSNQAH